MRGFRQGCALSMLLLYIIAVELLGTLLMPIRRLRFRRHEIKIVNFADSTIISRVVQLGKVKNKRVLFTLVK